MLHGTFSSPASPSSPRTSGSPYNPSSPFKHHQIISRSSHQHSASLQDLYAVTEALNLELQPQQHEQEVQERKRAMKFQALALSPRRDHRRISAPLSTTTSTSTSTDNSHHTTTLDDQSQVSELPCGSILPDPKYDPTKDPAIQGRPFVPPIEITIKVKIEVPEWLRLDTEVTPKRSHTRPRLGRRRSAPDTEGTGPSRPSSVVRQCSWNSKGETQPVESIPTLPWKCAGSAISSGTLRTSPIDFSISDDDELSSKLQAVPEKATVDGQRSPFLGRLSLFQKHRKTIDLKRARGCLT